MAKKARIDRNQNGPAPDLSAQVEMAIDHLEQRLDTTTAAAGDIENAGERLLNDIFWAHHGRPFQGPIDDVVKLYERRIAQLETMPLRPRRGMTLYEGLRNYVEFGILPGQLVKLQKFTRPGGGRPDRSEEFETFLKDHPEISDDTLRKRATKTYNALATFLTQEGFKCSHSVAKTVYKKHFGIK